MQRYIGTMTDGSDSFYGIRLSVRVLLDDLIVLLMTRGTHKSPEWLAKFEDVCKRYQDLPPELSDIDTPLPPHIEGNE